MIGYDEIQISKELSDRVDQFLREVESFRAEGPLDAVSLAKLEEHFKASHVYHSAGIEGNRLTLQETVLVLTEGIEIRGERLPDSLEVKNLGVAFDFLKTLASTDSTIRETDVRDLHRLLIGIDPFKQPGEYRRVGVVILGSEHKPCEPFDVPQRMETLVKWVNANITKNPVLVAAVSHHELAHIHPFVDGNGRVARLFMNLILMKRGVPICNIKRGPEKAAYYEALGFADVGLYESIIKLVADGCSELFAEYVRIRTETKRMQEWTQRWGTKERETLIRRESRNLDLWKSRIKQVYLEFQKATEGLDDNLQQVEIQFYDYNTEISFEKYQQLLEQGQTQQANAFSISFLRGSDQLRARFMFRYFRNWQKFKKKSIIPLELNYYDEESHGYVRLNDLTYSWVKAIRIRELYFHDDGRFVVRWFDRTKGIEIEYDKGTISDAVQWFFDDILRHVFSLIE